MVWVWVLLLAAGDDKLVRAKQAYDEYEFDKAAQLYKDALQAPEKVAPSRLQDAYLFHAFSAFIAGKPEARDALKKLFKLNPSHVLDKRGLHPDLVTFYDKERQKVVVAKPVPLEKPPDVQAQVVPKAPQLQGYEAAHPGLRWLPFGIGQFCNRDPVAGSLWLTAGVALAATHVAFTLLQQRSYIAGSDNEYSDTNAPTYWYVRTASAAALISVGIMSLIDALVWSPARGEARFNARVTAVLFDRGAGVALGAHFP